MVSDLCHAAFLGILCTLLVLCQLVNGATVFADGHADRVRRLPLQLCRLPNDFQCTRLL